MARVFISHANEDRGLAAEVHQWLVYAGHEVFLAHDLGDGIALGEEWEQRLHERLRWANAVVCVVTSIYVASTWCAIEIGIAKSREIRLLPLRSEPGVVHHLLATLHDFDYSADPASAHAAVLKALDQVDTAWPEDGYPFPGLRPFDASRRQVFFGRDGEIGKLAELLRSPAESALLLIVGPSGCGKSSLVGAGLLPVLDNELGWRALRPILPGADPVAELARELAATARDAGLGWTVEYIGHQLTQRGLTGLVDELLLADSAGPQRRLLIAVDQFEELFTQTTRTERARFAELLRPALTGPVRVVATLRPEFLGQLLVDPALDGLPTRTYILRPLGREALRAVIEKPAALAKIKVDDGLVDRLVEDTGEALPLLAFTLAQLAEGVGRGGRLSSARYDQLGGVQGALKHQANAALTDAITAGGRTSDQVIAGLLRLVTVDEQGRPTRWRANRDELPDHIVTELDAFVARRLLTTDTDNGTVVIGVAHEAFLSAWPDLAQAITEKVTPLRARRAVEHAAEEWHRSGRPAERLWSGGQLAAAVIDTGARIRRNRAGGESPAGQQDPPYRLPWRRGVLVTDRVDVNPVACDFLHAGIRRDRSRRQRLTTVLSVLLIGALVAAGVAVYQADLAQEQLRITTAQNLITRADAIRESDPHTALLLGIAAVRILPDVKTRAGLVHTLTTSRYAGTLANDVASPVTSVAFSPDGRTLATGTSGGIVTRWDLAGPTPRRQPPLTLSSAVTSVAFSPDGRTLAGASLDGTVTLLDLADPTQSRQSMIDHSGAVYSVAFSPDGRTLATTGDGRTVMLWDVTDPTQPQQRGSPLTGHAAGVFSVVFSPDGLTLASGDADGIVILWDLVDPTRRQQSFPAHARAVNSVAFSPDGRTLATASDDSTAILWQLTDPTRPQPLGPPLTSHTSRVTAVAFSSDSSTLATAGHDSTAIVWDLTDRVRSSGPLAGQPSQVESLMFARDGHTLTVTGSDGTVIQRDLTEPGHPLLGPPQPQGDGLVDSLAVAPDGNITVAPGDRSSVILWDRTGQSRPRPLGTPLVGHRRMVTSAAFSADGRTLATGSADGDVILWDVTDRTRPRPLRQPLAGHRSVVATVAFSPDGGTLATGGDDGQVILWDLIDRSQPRPFGKPLVGGTGPVTSVAFAPDGNTLATGDSAATVILWDLSDLTQLRADATARACAITGRGLDRGEWDSYVLGLPYQNTC